ncbi:hypothetical protein LZD49_18325 [Dyadobacter sp. CY261]|uniref:hypothetical protein n=1 Tax=Dyadobacter sp. CY261 TaxID=2907203 RepID=UPI001F47097E|nr:hypothetical protein [Dyadobacter sp. CY261]MCF0072445.1 hypothetical protein [Dyadobacter sp. CY261]
MEPREPNEDAIERMRQEGATQDKNNPQRFEDRNGRTVGYAEDGKVKIENGQWENA